MVSVMNATAQASTASISGSKLDNRRVLAALVDVGIVLAGTVVILFAADALSGDSGEIRGALGAVILGWALYYHFAMESGDGQTVGKKLMKLRVVRADGRPAGMREIAVRTVLRVVDSIGFYIVGLIVMLATGERRQRLGDLAAGTKIVDASATAYAPPARVAVPVAETVVEGDAPADLTAPEAPGVPEMRPFDPPTAEDEPVGYAEPVEDAPVEDEPVAVVEDFETVEPVEDEPVGYVEPVEDERRGAGRGRARRAGQASVGRGRARGAGRAGRAGRGRAGRRAHDRRGHRGRRRRGRAGPPLAIVEVDEPSEDEVAEDELPDISTPSLEQLAHDVVAARAESSEDEPADEPMTLRSVETVSAIDLVMGAAGGRLLGAGSGPRGPRRLVTNLAMPTLVGSRWQRLEQPNSR